MSAESFVAGLRRLMHVVRGADLSAVDLDGPAAAIEDVVATIEPHVTSGVRMQAALSFEDVMTRFGALEGRRDRVRAAGPTTIFPYSPYIGSLNPLSPPATVWLEPGEGEWDTLVGEVCFDDAFNGPPDAVHGGVIAGLLDEMLGSVCVSNDVGGFTGTLTVRYRSPTMLGTQVQLRAWIDRVEGRKTFAAGSLHCGDTLLAEAEGVFISADSLPDRA